MRSHKKPRNLYVYARDRRDRSERFSYALIRKKSELRSTGTHLYINTQDLVEGWIYENFNELKAVPTREKLGFTFIETRQKS